MQKHISIPCLFALLFVQLTPMSAASAGGIIKTGVTVPQLTALDDLMVDFMNEYAISGGVLALSRNGCIIYQRGFGTDARYIVSVRPMSEITPMRIASVEKPLCAAVVRNMAAGGWFELDDFIFDLGQPEGGLLNIQPYDGLGDSRLRDITVLDLLQHVGGWDIEEMTWCDSDVRCDPQFKAIHIAEEMEISSPPGRVNTVRYMLSQSLTYTPGTQYAYSNFGFMVLGLLIENLTGPVDQNVRTRILTSDMWIPGSEIYKGRTFYGQQPAREPRYISRDLVTNVFNPDGDDVARPYGGWDHESFQGHGNLVCSAAPLLKFLDRYRIIGGNIGMPIQLYSGGDLGHAGAIEGTSTMAHQRSDGINIVVLINDREDSGEPHHGIDLTNRVNNLIDSGGITNWPTKCVDGMWVNFTAHNPGFGGFSDPFDDMDEVVDSVWDGTKLHFQPGTSGTWSGVLDKKMLLDAPYGNVTIGGS